MTDPQAIIIGSGPAGVSAAWPLVEAGVRVLMLDAADDGPLPHPPTGTISQFRERSDRWKMQFGPDLSGLFLDGDYSPKLATPLARHARSRFDKEMTLVSDNFMVVGSLVKGGLSSIWGANVAVYDDADLIDYPISRADLLPSYTSVIHRIGLSGDADPALGIEPGPELTAPLAHVLTASRKKAVEGFRISRAINAVLGVPQGVRKPCASCGLCLWGCHRQSIYTSAHDVERLCKFEMFSYRPHSFVRSIGNSAHGPVVEIDGATFTAPRVILAAGTLATTALVMRLVGNHVPVRLETNPVAAIAFVVPKFIGRPLTDHSFSLAQLSYQISHQGVGAAGALYGGDTLPLTEVANRLPVVSRRSALGLSRALAPALVFATCYLPGRYSNNRIAVSASGEITITGRQRPVDLDLHKAVLKQLAKRMGQLGAYALPRSATISQPGTDVHYAATLPMGGSLIGVDGAVRACPGLYVVDGAVLPTLPARHCTLTIMANADRIARQSAVVHAS